MQLDEHLLGRPVSPRPQAESAVTLAGAGVPDTLACRQAGQVWGGGKPPDGSLIRVEVWPKLIFRNESGRLSKNGSQCSAVELAVLGDGQRLRGSCST
jgi:hypothetical protein